MLPDVEVGPHLEIVSLVDQFGRQRAETDTVACIERVTTELLDRPRESRRRSPRPQPGTG